MRANMELLNGEPMDDIEVLRSEISHLGQKFDEEVGALKDKLINIQGVIDPMYARGTLMEGKDIDLPSLVEWRRDYDGLLKMFNRLIGVLGEPAEKVGRDGLYVWIVETVAELTYDLASKDAAYQDLMTILTELRVEA